MRPLVRHKAKWRVLRGGRVYRGPACSLNWRALSVNGWRSVTCKLCLRLKPT